MPVPHPCRSSRLLSWFLLLAGFTAVAAGANEVEVPPGYYVHVYTDAVPFPTAMAFAPDSTLYVTDLFGDVVAIVDADGNGVADGAVLTASFPTKRPLGITVHDGAVFVGMRGAVMRLQDLNGDLAADVVDTLIAGMPYQKHQTAAVAFGPDSLLYVSVGSEDNLSVGAHPWYATVLRFDKNGNPVDTFAEGLRNTLDLAFHASGDLFGCDNAPGADSTFACEEAPDELNWIRGGLHFGYPYCSGFGDCVDRTGECDPVPCGPGDCEWMSGCADSMAYPIGDFEAHASPNGLVFGDGFKGYGANDLFVAEYGKTEILSCEDDNGRVVTRRTLTWNGIDWTAGPRETWVGRLNRPIDVTVGPDSALYVADIGAGCIYRVFKTRPGTTGIRTEPTRGPARLTMSPNPAQARVMGRWDGVTGEFTVDIVTTAGRRVRSLEVASGEVFRWDLRDAADRRVAPGLYWIRARTRDRTARGKLIVLR